MAARNVAWHVPCCGLPPSLFTSMHRLPLHVVTVQNRWPCKGQTPVHCRCGHQQDRRQRGAVLQCGEGGASEGRRRRGARCLAQPAARNKRSPHVDCVLSGPTDVNSQHGWAARRSTAAAAPPPARRATLATRPLLPPAMCATHPTPSAAGHRKQDVGRCSLLPLGSTMGRGGTICGAGDGRPHHRTPRHRTPRLRRCRPKRQGIPQLPSLRPS